MDESKKIKMYGFYSGNRKLIAAIPARSTEEAEKKYKEKNTDIEYMFVEVMY